MGLSLAEGLTPFLDQAESRCTKFLLEFTRGTLRLYDQYWTQGRAARVWGREERCVTNAGDFEIVKAGTSTYHVFDTIKNGGYLF